MTQNAWGHLYRLYANAVPFYIKDLLLESSPLQDDCVEEVIWDRLCTLLETNSPYLSQSLCMSVCTCLCVHTCAHVHLHVEAGC